MDHPNFGRKKSLYLSNLGVAVFSILIILNGEANILFLLLIFMVFKILATYSFNVPMFSNADPPPIHIWNLWDQGTKHSNGNFFHVWAHFHLLDGLRWHQLVRLVRRQRPLHHLLRSLTPEQPAYFSNALLHYRKEIRHLIVQSDSDSAFIFFQVFFLFNFMVQIVFEEINIIYEVKEIGEIQITFFLFLICFVYNVLLLGLCSAQEWALKSSPRWAWPKNRSRRFFDGLCFWDLEDLWTWTHELGMQVSGPQEHRKTSRFVLESCLPWSDSFPEPDPGPNQ